MQAVSHVQMTPSYAHGHMPQYPVQQQQQQQQFSHQQQQQQLPPQQQYSQQPYCQQQQQQQFYQPQPQQYIPYQQQYIQQPQQPQCVYAKPACDVTPVGSFDSASAPFARGCSANSSTVYHDPVMSLDSNSVQEPSWVGTPNTVPLSPLSPGTGLTSADDDALLALSSPTTNAMSPPPPAAAFPAAAPAAVPAPVLPSALRPKVPAAAPAAAAPSAAAAAALRCDLRRLADGEFEQTYTLERLLGRGQHGVVWKAERNRTADDSDGEAPRPVAAKVSRLGGMTEDEVSMALKEVAVLKSLSHPNIVRTVDSFVAGPSLVILLELCENGDLAAVASSRLVSNTPFSQQDLMLLLTQVALAIRHLHCAGVCHNDLKPSNILLMSNGIVKLADFGVSQTVRRSKGRVQGLASPRPRRHSAPSLRAFSPRPAAATSSSPRHGRATLLRQQQQQRNRRPSDPTGGAAVASSPRGRRRERLRVLVDAVEAAGNGGGGGGDLSSVETDSEDEEVARGGGSEEVARGTPLYWPPEVWHCVGHSTPIEELDTLPLLTSTAQFCKKKADVWSLGVICYEMSELQRPFRGETLAEVANNVLNTDVHHRLTKMADARGDCFVEALCMMLQADPGTRSPVSRVLNTPYFQRGLAVLRSVAMNSRDNVPEKARLLEEIANVHFGTRWKRRAVAAAAAAAQAAEEQCDSDGTSVSPASSQQDQQPQAQAQRTAVEANEMRGVVMKLSSNKKGRVNLQLEGRCLWMQPYTKAVLAAGPLSPCKRADAQGVASPSSTKGKPLSLYLVVRVIPEPDPLEFSLLMKADKKVTFRAFTAAECEEWVRRVELALETLPQAA